MSIQKVAVFGVRPPSTLPPFYKPITNTAIQASGNFGAPITAALTLAGFDVTVISRADSAATFPPGLPVKRVPYTLADLTAALAGQDAAVCAVGPAGIGLHGTMVDAAEAAGVKRFIVDDFGWGRYPKTFPEFAEIHKQRSGQWDYAKDRAERNGGFSWTGISSGNPVDWVGPVFICVFV